MKAIITIIVLALVAWGVWWFVTRDDTATPVGTNTSEVQGAVDVNADAGIDLSDFESKG